MRNDFSILIASDPEHERVYAEIEFDNKFIALVAQEHGINDLEVELNGLGADGIQVSRVPLAALVATLHKAASKLTGREIGD